MLYSQFSEISILYAFCPYLQTTDFLIMARKFQNLIEMDGLKNAHVRDGAAVVQYLVWLDKQVTHLQAGNFCLSDFAYPSSQLNLVLTISLQAGGGDIRGAV
ncbi:hypothetical protein RND81_05G021200 [Saponaria officinalis]|uniref:Uncharacterized protein n=1 Tax=Saponaria officinalis TaxID=3572 RepID=A0AAW1KUM4_SAPOF